MPVRIFISATVCASSASHILYSISIHVGPVAQQWTVNRRYSQFLTLRNELVERFERSNGVMRTKKRRCSGCDRFLNALVRFEFPKKHFVLTNRIIRGRVQALQQFLKLIVKCAFDMHRPKCYTCGVSTMALLQPFLLRGAQPIGMSTRAKIKSSLSFQTLYPHPHPHPQQGEEYRLDDDDDDADDAVSWTSTAPCSSSSCFGSERLEQNDVHLISSSSLLLQKLC